MEEEIRENYGTTRRLDITINDEYGTTRTLRIDNPSENDLEGKVSAFGEVLLNPETNIITTDGVEDPIGYVADLVVTNTSNVSSAGQTGRVRFAKQVVTISAANSETNVRILNYELPTSTGTLTIIQGVDYENDEFSENGGYPTLTLQHDLYEYWLNIKFNGNQTTADAYPILLLDGYPVGVLKVTCVAGD